MVANDEIRKLQLRQISRPKLTEKLDTMQGRNYRASTLQKAVTKTCTPSEDVREDDTI
jgi:hypothetical protein